MAAKTAPPSPSILDSFLRGGLQPVMVDAPGLAVPKAEAFGGGQKEHAPAPPPHGGIRAIDGAQDGIDGGAIGIEQRQPLPGRALVMAAAPAPFLFHGEEVGKLPDQPYGGHDAAGEEMLAHPVLRIASIIARGAVAVGEDVKEQPSLRLQPGP